MHRLNPLPFLILFAVIFFAPSVKAQGPQSQPTPPVIQPVPSAAIPECRGLSPAQVKVQFLVGVDGKAQNIKVLNSPDAQHVTCVTKMVDQSHFVPAKDNGKPFAANVVINLNIAATR